MSKVYEPVATKEISLPVGPSEGSLKLNATEILPVVLNRQGIIGVDSLVRDIVSEVLIAAKEVDLSIWPQDNRIDNCHLRHLACPNS